MRILISTLSLLIGIAFTTNLSAQDRSKAIETAKSLTEKHGNAVVSLLTMATAKQNAFGMSFGGKDKVHRAQATFVDDTGMAIVPYSAVTPASGMVVRFSNVGGEEEEIRDKDEIKKLEFVLADGTRVEAKVVIADPKLDIAIIAPEKPLDAETRKKIAFIPIDKPAEPKLLDYLITMSRLSPDLNSQTSLGISRVSAVVTKPRLVFVTPVQAGVVCFDDQGRFVGIGGLHKSQAEGLGAGMASETVVIPGKYIQEVVEQAREKLKKSEK